MKPASEFSPSPGAGAPEWAAPLLPRFTSSLFRPLLSELLDLLRGLDPSDWDRPTLAGAWKVRDVAAHLLDGDLRKLAACRDDRLLQPGEPLRSNQDLVRMINGLNATGVAFGARLSPRLLTDLLETTGAWVAEFVEGLPPHEPSVFAVSWAGESESLNWMDTGREYTERWHHQMQVRDALGRERLLAPVWMEPLIDLSIRALPAAYASVPAPDGAVVALEVHGPTAGVWSVLRADQAWQVLLGRPPSPNAVVRVQTDDFWRVFYNAVRSPGLKERIEVRGDRVLAEPLLSARSVIV